MGRYKSAADYAAIAVAPLLIFIMISALANFLVLLLYKGGFPQRVSWTLLMFTMGVVAIARIAIEQNRAYSLGYAAALGAATFVVMSRFIGSPMFCAFILVVIAVLADVIVRDCTMIEDDVDASGEGLIDAGRLFVKQRFVAESSGDQVESEQAPTVLPAKRKQHQPGRTVMYLALAALPFFGLGQFMIGSSASSWGRAQMLLAIYLFAALGLLVTTSFLGLRRYLRQRGTEMPGDVTISWLGGGVALIAAILMVTYLLPMPGSTLASIETPSWLASLGETSASQWGWGEEGADQSDPDDATTTPEKKSVAQESQSQSYQQGAEAGDVGQGERSDGPTGNQAGGDQNASESGEAKSNEGDQQAGNQQSGDDSQATNKPDPQQTDQQQTDQQQTDQQQTDQPQTDPPQTDQQGDRQPQPAFESRPYQNRSARALEWLGNGIAGIGNLIKWIIMLVLAVVVAWFAWSNWQRLVQWIQGLLNNDPVDQETVLPNESIEPTTPPRPFSSYRNPIGREPDLRKVVVITFQAFEAWAREQGAVRRQDETPSEFLQRTRLLLPSLAQSHADLIGAYNRIVYGRGKANDHDLAAADQVWQSMR